MRRALLVPVALLLVASCLPSEGTGTTTGAGGNGGSQGEGGSTGSGGDQTGKGGSGGAGGAGGSGQGGTGGSGGSSAQGGSGGNPTDGGAGKGGAGGAGGDGGGAGAGGAGGGGANPVCDSVKSFLDGFEYILNCGVDQSYSVLVCQNTMPRCTYNNSEYLLTGTCNADKKFTVAGTGSCTITLHVQGVVEPKHYFTGTNRCTTNFGSAFEGFVSGPANGGVTSGCYPNTSGAYNVYMMHVSDSATALTGTNLTGTRYYWNGLNQNEAHFSYKIDYTTPSITIKGGQTIWMLADDNNQSAIKNCDTTSNDVTSGDQNCHPITVANIAPAPGPAITQPINGQFVLLHVASAQ